MFFLYVVMEHEIHPEEGGMPGLSITKKITNDVWSSEF